MMVSRLLDTLSQLTRVKILVLGDLMLDRYVWADIDRPSPEAPVLVVAARTSEIRLGGAANLAVAAQALGASVTVVGVVGDDNDGISLRHLLQQHQINSDLLVVDSSRRTTVKERVMAAASGRHVFQQVVRIDHEARFDVGDGVVKHLLDGVMPRLRECDAVLISDYAKGCCSPNIVRPVVAEARRLGLPVIVDPPSAHALSKYNGVTLVKTNRLEAQSATNSNIVDFQSAIEAGSAILEQYNLKGVVVTVNALGLVAVSCAVSESYSSDAREIHDITGAGDVVMAILGVATASGSSLCQAAELANFGAGLKVEKQGTAVVTTDELRFALSSRGLKRIIFPQLGELRRATRQRAQSIAFTNGCYDLLHIGHVRSLQQAAQEADLLVVGVNADGSVRRLKGCTRPLISQDHRAEMLAALSCVSHVIIFDDPTPHEIICALEPDVLIKGGDYNVDAIVGREVVEKYGGRVTVTTHVESISTTLLIETISRQSPTPSNPYPQVTRQDHR